MVRKKGALKFLEEPEVGKVPFRCGPAVARELHFLRLGETALATSPFELYLDYGMRIRARSPAAVTLHAQRSCDEAGYLPTARAVEAGGYGALVANGVVGPEGGQLLLRRLFAD